MDNNVWFIPFLIFLVLTIGGAIVITVLFGANVVVSALWGGLSALLAIRWMDRYTSGL